jgi:hypothetical protein
VTAAFAAVARARCEVYDVQVRRLGPSRSCRPARSALAARLGARSSRAARVPVVRALSALLASLGGAAHAEPAAEPRELLVLTVAPPLDEKRLADALRAYLEGFEVQIERSVAPGAAAGTAAAEGDLRALLAGMERAGHGARALATVRVAPGAPGQAEIVLVDRLTGKALVTSVTRPRRDEDLFRTVALKVHALLRATLAESPERLGDRPSLLRLAAATTAAPWPDAGSPGRLFMETAYAAAAFPGDGLLQHGVAATAGWRAGPRWELRLGVAALTAVRAEAAGVAVTLNRIPVRLSAQLRWPVRTFELLVGPEIMAALAEVDASSTELQVRSGRALVAAAGLGAAGRARVSRMAWVYVRAAALGLLLAERYTVQGEPVLALSGLETDVELGLGVDVW